MSPESQAMTLIIGGVVIALIYLGVLKPLGLLSELDLPELPKKTQDERIAELECSTNMCAHAVDDEHPMSMVGRNGTEFWRLSDGRWWRKDEPCPYR